MKKAAVGLVVALALVAGACSLDAAGSEAYQSLETEMAALEQQLAFTESELTAARDTETGEAIAVEVLAVLDQWWAANDRADGSVVDLYTATGYHLYGDKKVSGDELVTHFSGAVNPEWITEPYLVAAEPEGRYVVTRGLRGGASASALSFEILTGATGELKIAQTAWLYVH